MSTASIRLEIRAGDPDAARVLNGRVVRLEVSSPW